jgi:hypothetical protein
LKELHDRWGSQVRFVEVEIRQAHPGPEVPPYVHFDDKVKDAQQYQREHEIPWTVLVDDLQGTVHQAYNGLADPTFLIDAEGRVAFVNALTHAPTLHRAIETLIVQGSLGVVDSGWDRVPRLGPTLTDGWKGLRRGLPQSLIDIELAGPGSGIGSWLGHQLRPALAPLTLRSTPLPAAIRIGLNAAGLLAGLLAMRWLFGRLRS